LKLLASADRHHAAKQNRDRKETVEQTTVQALVEETTVQALVEEMRTHAT
jgi:hypothetical protein